MTKRKQYGAQSPSSSISSESFFSSSSTSSSSPSSSSSEHSDPDPNPKLQIIICSCSTHLAQGTIRINPSLSKATSSHPYTLEHLASQYPTFPHLTDLLTAFTPSPLSSLIHTHAVPYLTLINPYIPHNLSLTPQAALSRFGELNLPSRARKYIHNPLLTLGLANRTRIGAQSIGVMSFRLCFNIFVVVAWLLIRRFAEIFGVKLRPLSIKSQRTDTYKEERNESTVVVAREGAGWDEIQECGRERERARRMREAWIEVEAE